MYLLKEAGKANGEADSSTRETSHLDRNTNQCPLTKAPIRIRMGTTPFMPCTEKKKAFKKKHRKKGWSLYALPVFGRRVQRGDLRWVQLKDASASGTARAARITMCDMHS